MSVHVITRLGGMAEALPFYRRMRSVEMSSTNSGKVFVSNLDKLNARLLENVSEGTTTFRVRLQGTDKANRCMYAVDTGTAGPDGTVAKWDRGAMLNKAQKSAIDNAFNAMAVIDARIREVWSAWIDNDCASVSNTERDMYSVGHKFVMIARYTADLKELLPVALQDAIKDGRVPKGTSEENFLTVCQELYTQERDKRNEEAQAKRDAEKKAKELANDKTQYAAGVPEAPESEFETEEDTKEDDES